jgi:hypothetical protein
LRLRLLTGEDQLDRPIRWVVTTDMPDPSRYLAGDELVLTGLVWWHEPADSEGFVATLAAAGVSGLAAGEAALGSVPDDLVDACRRHRMPLFAVPVDVSFATITEAVVRQLAAQRAGDLVTVLDRHRRLLAASADASSGLGAVLDLVSRELGLECWVLSATGERVAGAPSLPPALELRLAREFLQANRLPATVRLAGGEVYTVLAAAPAAHRITSWFVAVTGDSIEWPPERHRLADELVALVGAERDQLARQRANPLAGELIELVLSGAETPEFLPQLRACGFSPDSEFLAIVAATPGAGMLAAAVLAEVLRPIVPAAAVGAGGPGATAFAPVERERAAVVLEQIRTAVHALEPGLADLSLHIGASGVAAGAGALGGAAAEARYACRLAALRPGRAAVVGDDELSSHMLLLAGVPADLRRTFTDRVIGPVRDYDREHGSDLVPTLTAFLDCSGSWTRCAEILHVHVNTLRYRIQRIEQLTGRDLSALPDRVDLFLAIQLL